jgi:hypothetical protein
LSQELIHVRNGRASLSDAVVQVAHILNPIGAAGAIIATLAACCVEIGRFKSQALDLRTRHAIASDMIKTRQGIIVGLFEQRAQDSSITRLAVDELSWGYRRMINHACDMGVTSNDRELAHGTVRMLSLEVGNQSIQLGQRLILLSDSLQLGDTKAAIESLRMLER